MSEEPTARLMLRALRRFERDLHERIRGAGYTDVSIGNMNLLRHLDPEGMRMSELAEHAGITKQAVTQGTRALVQRELVTLEVDPADRRAKIVAYTPHGKAFIAVAIEHVLALEQELAATLGADHYAQLRDSLQRMD